MSLVKPYGITLRLCSGQLDLEILLVFGNLGLRQAYKCSGGAGLRNFTGFREFRPTAGLQVIVPLKLGLKNILIGLT